MRYLEDLILVGLKGVQLHLEVSEVPQGYCLQSKDKRTAGMHKKVAVLYQQSLWPGYTRNRD